MTDPHPAQIKWRDPLALARDIRKRHAVLVRLGGDYAYIKEQAERSGVSVEDFLIVSARWHANEVAKQTNPTRMPPVMHADPSVRLDMEACVEQIERLGAALNNIADYDSGEDRTLGALEALATVKSIARAALR